MKIMRFQGGKEIDVEQKIKSEGIVPLQAGTNRLASQKGMTGFGTPRNVLQKQGWKKEWLVNWSKKRENASAPNSTCKLSIL